jgi:hypothetical protein
MPHYYIRLANDRCFDDTDGLELPDLAAACEEASGFARDLMRSEPARRDWRGWSVRVTDEDQQPLFELPFPDAPDIAQSGGSSFFGHYV